jgi:hypothetical protein
MCGCWWHMLIHVVCHQGLDACTPPMGLHQCSKHTDDPLDTSPAASPWSLRSHPALTAWAWRALLLLPAQALLRRPSGWLQ